MFFLRFSSARAIRSTLDAALTMAEAWRREREHDLAQGAPGFYLDFEIHPGSEMAADLGDRTVSPASIGGLRFVPVEPSRQRRLSLCGPSEWHVFDVNRLLGHWQI
jgi:hypothetical protein